MVEGRHAVHLGPRQVQTPRHDGHGLGRDMPEGMLQGMQDGQQGALLVGVRRDDLNGSFSREGFVGRHALTKGGTDSWDGEVSLSLSRLKNPAGSNDSSAAIQSFGSGIQIQSLH